MYITYDIHRGSKHHHTNGREVVLISDEVTPETVISYVNQRRNSFDMKPIGVSQNLCDRAKQRAAYLRQRPIPSTYSRQFSGAIDKPLFESGEYLDLVLSDNCRELGVSTFKKKVGDKDVTYTIQVLTFKKS